MNEEVLTTDTEVNQSKFKKTVRNIGLGALFLFFLILFTVTKLPQTKLTALLQGYVQLALDPYGIYMSDHGRDLSIWKGFEYRLIQPSLELADQTRIDLDEVVVKPKLLGLLTGQTGAHAVITQGNAIIDLDGSGRGDKINSTIELTEVDIGKFGLLSFAGGLKGAGLISGKIHIEGTLSDPPSLNGSINLKLKRLKLDEQNMMGFQLPAMTISDGTVDITIERGKLLMKNVQIGKATDDLQMGITGDITLNRFMNASALNLKAVLGISEKVKQSISLIDSLLGPARQADGRYAYKVTGTMGAPFPVPETQATR
jgi:type II secretion system protein N